MIGAATRRWSRLTASSSKSTTCSRPSSPTPSAYLWLSGGLCGHTCGAHPAACVGGGALVSTPQRPSLHSNTPPSPPPPSARARAARSISNLQALNQFYDTTAMDSYVIASLVKMQLLQVLCVVCCVLCVCVCVCVCVWCVFEHKCGVCVCVRGHRSPTRCWCVCPRRTRGSVWRKPPTAARIKIPLFPTFFVRRLSAHAQKTKQNSKKCCSARLTAARRRSRRLRCRTRSG